ncbi:MAG: hypothetical protein ACUVX9_06875 [Anaerolineae bacterium]
MSKADDTRAPPSPWDKLCWLTPTPVPLMMQGSMAWTAVIGSCSLSVRDPARLAMAEEVLQQGGTLPLAAEQAAQTVWNHLGPPRACREYVQRLLSGHGADVAIEAALGHQNLVELSGALPQLAEVLRARVAPMLASLGLQIEHLSFDDLDDCTRWGPGAWTSIAL